MIVRFFIAVTMGLLGFYALGSFAMLWILGSMEIFNVWLILFFYVASVTFLVLLPKAVREWNDSAAPLLESKEKAAIDCIGNMACFAGNCRYCCGDGGPHMYYCGGCCLPNCGFGECQELQERLFMQAHQDRILRNA